jgi:hypothetical protein
VKIVSRHGIANIWRRKTKTLEFDILMITDNYSS